MINNLEFLIKKYGNKIPYPELLQCKEWKKKRAEILKRDDYCCTYCEKEGTELFLAGKPYIFKEIPLRLPPDLGGDIYGYKTVGKKQKKAIFLQVHHKYYYLDKYPWEYNNDALVALCEDCHNKVHETEKIPVFKSSTDQNPIYQNLTPCSKCNGIGFFNQYRHVENGVCFRCYGKGYEELINNRDYW